MAFEAFNLKCHQDLFVDNEPQSSAHSLSSEFYRKSIGKASESYDCSKSVVTLASPNFELPTGFRDPGKVLNNLLNKLVKIDDTKCRKRYRSGAPWFLYISVLIMVANKTLVFAQVPKGIPVAGEDLRVENRPFDIEAATPAGGFVGRVLHASFDPYLRHRLVDAAGARDFPPFQLGAPIVNSIVVEVLNNDSEAGFLKGDILVGMGPIAEYVVVSTEEAATYQRVQNPYSLDLKLFLGPLGMPGLAAYSAFYEIGKPRKGETIFISSASGAVGQIVGQLAKREGLTVIGSVGSDEKLDALKVQLKFDEGFNYKKVDILNELKALAPKGLDSMASTSVLSDVT